jgi:predicted nucleic acid-binding protein
MVSVVKIVFNSSPLIFLARLDFLRRMVDSADTCYLPPAVLDEIHGKHNHSTMRIEQLMDEHLLQVKSVNLLSLATRLHQRLGSGESEAIALAVEWQADYVVLDDVTARQEALRLGLNVKGTLAMIRRLQAQNTIQLDNLDEFYQKLVDIKFRIKRKIFDDIFRD